MWTLVYYSFEIKTYKSLDEVTTSLERLIKTDKDSQVRNTDTSYYRPLKGELNTNNFSVVGNYANINSFRPFITGKLIRTNGRNTVRVKMFMHWLVILVLSLVLLLSSWDLVSLIIAVIALIAFNIETYFRQKQLKQALT